MPRDALRQVHSIPRRPTVGSRMAPPSRSRVNI